MAIQYNSNCDDTASLDNDENIVNVAIYVGGRFYVRKAVASRPLELRMFRPEVVATERGVLEAINLTQ